MTAQKIELLFYWEGVLTNYMMLQLLVREKVLVVKLIREMLRVEKRCSMMMMTI
jgi:hypothetical protein